MAPLCFLLSASVALAAGDVETFHGWSKDGTWYVVEKQSGPNDHVDLHFCQSDPALNPKWDPSLKDGDREKNCMVVTDPNRAPYGWKRLLELPKSSFNGPGGFKVSHELVTDGEGMGYVVDVGGGKTVSCSFFGLRESSKITQAWFHPSGRFVVAVIDGRVAPCGEPLKSAEASKPDSKKGGKKPPPKKKK